MAAPTSIRVAAKRRLVELLTDQPILEGVQVTYGWPGNDLQHESVWVGATRGPVTIPTMRAGRKARDDLFTIDVHFMAGTPGQPDAETADARVEELYTALEDVLATKNTLDDLDGILRAIQNGDVEFADPQATDQGWVGFCTATVEIHARLD